ncbi:esterase, partial [Dactylosporangium sp. NPDC049140]
MRMGRLLTAAALAAATALTAVALAAAPAMAAGLTQVTGFGNNPTGLGMYIYVPARVAPRPAL